MSVTYRGQTQVASLGLLGACRKARVEDIQILTREAHSSLYKAASIVGIGKASVIELASKNCPEILDLVLLERKLENSKNAASIVVVNAGEVNGGKFTSTGYEFMAKVAKLCHKHSAWLHVDGGMTSASESFMTTCVTFEFTIY
jgi:glutamate/tyrosine decarboxylase-like PLP-dependent enzyme